MIWAWIFFPATPNVFPGEPTPLVVSAFPPKGAQPGSCALSSLDLNWFSKSPVSALESRLQDEAMGLWIPAHARTPVGSTWTWVPSHPHQPPAPSCTAFACFAWEMPETFLAAIGKTEPSPCKWEHLLPRVVLHIHPSNKALQLSERHSTFTDFLQVA